MRKLVRGFVAVLALLTASVAGAAASAPYELDKQYVLVKQQGSPPDTKKVLVQEFFWYGCPHCYAFDPYLEKWREHKPAWVNFERVPNTLGHEVGEVHARAFYVAQTLGIGDKIHTPLFDALHRDRLPLTTLDSIRDFFVQTAGIKAADFDAIADSFGVNNQLKRSFDLAVSYGIDSVPTIVVDGKYRTDAVKAGGFDDLIKVIDFLADKSRKERGLK
jgi:thiol:disulfide interchange protein DsbA